MLRLARTPVLTGLLFALTTSSCLDPDAPGNLVPPTVTEDPSLPSVALRDGVRIHLRTVGDPKNPTMIMLHGGPGEDMRMLLGVSALADRYFLVYWDQRGSGLSERVPASQFTIDTYAADLDEIVTRYANGAKVTLLGESWGAMFAALYIQRHPDRVAEAVLSEPGFLNGTIANETKLFTLDLGSKGMSEYGWSEGALSPDGYAREDFLLQAAQGWSQAGLYADPSDPDNFRIFRLGATAFRASPRAVQRNGTWDFDFSTGLDHFCNPVTLIGTTNNRVTGYEHQRTKHAPLFCNVDLVKLENADHGWIASQPARAVDVLRAHLGAYRSGQ